MSVDVVTVAPGDVYAAHVSGYGLGGTVSATIDVHRPSGRAVAEWTAEDEVILGEPVASLAVSGYSVTPWAGGVLR